MIPLLNDKPKYDIVIPSSGKEVRYRPYLIREEKVLLMAFESKDRKASYAAIVDTIIACTNGTVDPKELTLYDVEYLFTKIRSKSAGEIVNLTVKCEKCDTKNMVSIDIDAVVMERMDPKKTIPLTESVSVEVVYPNYMKAMNNPILLDSLKEHERLLELVISSIKTVITEEERIDVKDESRESIEAFVESLDEVQFDAILDFVSTAPRLKYVMDFDCPCGHHNHIEVRDPDFF